MNQKQPLGFDAFGRQCIINMLLSPEIMTQNEIEEVINKMASPKFADAEKTQQFIERLNLMGKTHAAIYVAKITAS